MVVPVALGGWAGRPVTVVPAVMGAPGWLRVMAGRADMVVMPV
jgi:hypothetical protein